ncbi:ComEC/Rec2 family competence protein [Parabacteroides sp. PF5-6]|uniref:ComEC/Rec2 family competence protein n=1 Tax=Parabacteroides sp. PF5-6 TaxID=1742403 RepID=UPI0024058156|nr:ComEC/Rec2 family competence protein [Parabacteroides sp. PF5-6]MDF9830712.1 competence protein ComEC [Parabacteroides sp. PF5-6]
MIAELRKRPFVRPLLCWIVGIVFSSSVYTSIGFGGLLCFLFVFLFVSLGLARFYPLALTYGNRWVGGSVLFFLLLLLSFTVSRFSTDYAYSSERMMAKPRAIQLELVESIDRLQLTDAEKSVLATLVLGYRKAMSRDAREKFSIAGVSHILSVSGFHVAVVAGFLTFFFSFLPRGNLFLLWLRYILLMLLVWSFVFISGMSAPATRAGIMFTFFQTGRLLQRSSDSYNTLAASAFCMLAYRPIYLFDIGFQLSYSAVFFILYLQPRLAAWIKVRNPVLAMPWRWITVTLAAQIGTTFLCLYYFGRFSVFFLYANLPVIVFANLLIPLGLLWLLLPAGVPGYSLLQSGLEWLTRLLVRVVDFIASLPGASVDFPFGLLSMIAGYGMLFLLFFYLRRRSPWMLLLALSLCLLLLLIRLFNRL